MDVFTSAAHQLRRTADWLVRRSAGTPAYDAASASRRTEGWNATASAINQIIFGSGQVLRERARDMVRKNPYAEQGIRSFTANAIGSGIKPRSMHPDLATRERIQDAWWRWTDQADADGITNFYGLQALACRSMIEGGDCFIRLRDRRLTDGLVVPLQLQLLEGEMVPYNKSESLANGSIIRQGIEFNRLGQRTAYHIHRNHPGDRTAFTSIDTLLPVPVPARNVLHLYKPLRPGQVRGVTWMANVLLKIYDFDQYADAELNRKKIAAMFSGFVRRPGDPEDKSSLETDADADDVTGSLVKLQSGTFQILGAGEEVDFAGTTELGQAYADFMRQVLMAIAAGIGVTYEQLTGDLTKVNYSSIRAGMLDFRKACEQFQRSVFIFQMCRGTWRRWLEAAALAGVIDAIDFNRNRADYERVVWVTPGWQWVDPKKEVEASILAIRAGIMSRAEVVAMLGVDIERLDEAIAEDNARADRLGLKFDSDGRAARGGAAPPAPAEAPSDEAMTEEEVTEVIEESKEVA